MATNTFDQNLGGIQDPFAGVDFSQLERSLRRPRTLIDSFLNLATTVLTLLALIPLFSVVLMLLWRGGKRLTNNAHGDSRRGGVGKTVIHLKPEGGVRISKRINLGSKDDTRG